MTLSQDENQQVITLLAQQLGQWQSLLATSTTANVRVYCEAKIIELQNELSLILEQ